MLMLLPKDEDNTKVNYSSSYIKHQALKTLCEKDEDEKGKMVSSTLDDEEESTLDDEEEYRRYQQEFEEYLNFIDFGKQEDEDLFRFYLQQFENIPLPDEQEISGPLQPPSVRAQRKEWARPEQVQIAFLPRHTSPSSQDLRIIANMLDGNRRDLSCFWLVWTSPYRDQFLSGLEFIVAPENWSVYRSLFQKIFDKFLKAFYQKIRGATFLDQLYPGYKRLLHKIQVALEWKKAPKDQLKADRSAIGLYQHYISEIESKYQQKGFLYVRDDTQSPTILKTPISDFIANCPYFKGNHAWAKIFFEAELVKRLQLQQKSINAGTEGETQAKMRINRAILRQRALKGQDLLPAVNRLCCATFFYFNYGIYDRVLSEFPVLAERQFTRLWEEKQQMGKQTEAERTMIDICALLNSGGGVLLFNTFKIYLQMCPKGEAMQIASFKKAKNLIAQEIRYIYPPVTMDQHIKVSFVPVVRNPITEGLPEEGRKYVEGLYVMRIVVRPEDKGQQVYFYAKQPHISFCVPIIVGESTCILRRSRPVKYIKLRFAQYYVSENDYADAQELAMLKRPYSNFTTHQYCKEAQIGIPLQKLIRRNNKQEEANLQKNFKHLTLLVTGKENHPFIQQKLKGRGIDCEIIVKYTNYGLKAANNSAALFHNVPFTRLLEEVAYQKDFEHNGRFALTIYVTSYIRLMDRNPGNPMPQEEFNILEDWLHKQHPNEKLTLWKYNDGKIVDFFIKTQNKLSNLFMYFVLNSHNEKSQFKNPKDLDKKDNHLTLFYPRDKKGLLEQKKVDSNSKARGGNNRT